jgi:glycosyltransferase involved in cell wall biosynthesis
MSLFFTRVSPFVRITQQRANLILVTNRDTRHAISSAYQNKTHIFPSVGFTREEICTPDFEPKTTAERCMILACVGELIPQKAHGLVIKALARLPEDQKAELWIIGDGVERKKLQDICEAYNLDGRIRFFGKISREAVFHMLNSIDIFLFPGLKDSGGIAILEAMFLEKPVICLNLGGPGEIVTDQCGIKVKANTPDQVANDFALAIKRLADDPKLRRKMGKACRRRVEEVFDWEKKGFKMMKFYDEARKPPTKEIYPGY